MLNKRLNTILLCCVMLLCGCNNNHNDVGNRGEIENSDSIDSKENIDPIESGEELELNLYIDGKTNYMQNLIGQFKVEHPEVQINITDYSDITAEDYKIKLASELMTGEGPDLLLLNNDGTGTLEFLPDMIKMLQSDIFMDINELEINFDHCNQTVLKAGLYENKQVMIPLNYSLGYMYTTRERLDEFGIVYEDNITLEDFAAALPAFYSNNHNKKAFLNYLTIPFFYRQNSMDLIDYQTGKLKDDRNSLESMEKLCRAYDNLFPGIFESNDNLKGYMAYRNVKNYGGTDTGMYYSGDLLFMSGRAFNGNYESLNMYNQIYATDIANGQTPLIITMPTIDGKMPAPYVTYYLTVNGNTENTEAVKYFIETATGDDFQYTSTGAGIPINNNIVNHMKEFYLAEGYDNTDPFGFVKACEFEKEFVESYFNAIENMSDPTYIDNTTSSYLFSIIRDYVANDKSIEDAYASAKSQVDFYLGE